MINRLRKYNLTIAVIFAVIILSMTSYIIFLIQVSNDLKMQIDTHIKEISAEVRDNVVAKIEEKFNILETFGLCLTGDEKEDAYLCGIFAEKNNFTNVEIIYDEEENHAGDMILTVSPENPDEMYIEMYAEVTGEKGRIIIVGRTNGEMLGSIVDVSAFGQKKSNTFICGRDGTIVVSSIAGVKTLETVLGKNTEKLKNHLKARTEPGYISFNEGRLKKYICYSQLSRYQNLYAVSIVSANIIEANYNNVYRKGIVFAWEISISIAVLLIYILYFNYRIRLYTEIVEERRAIYAKQFNGIIFEYKIKHKTLVIAGDAQSLLSYSPEQEFIDIEKMPVITAETKELFEKGWDGDDETGGKKEVKEDVMLEFIDKNCDVRTVKGTLTAVRDKRGRVIKVVGSITDKSYCTQETDVI